MGVAIVPRATHKAIFWGSIRMHVYESGAASQHAQIGLIATAKSCKRAAISDAYTLPHTH